LGFLHWLEAIGMDRAGLHFMSIRHETKHIGRGFDLVITST
jgi:hypothetical protein